MLQNITRIFGDFPTYLYKSSTRKKSDKTISKSSTPKIVYNDSLRGKYYLHEYHSQFSVTQNLNAQHDLPEILKFVEFQSI